MGSVTLDLHKGHVKNLHVTQPALQQLISLIVWYEVFTVFKLTGRVFCKLYSRVRLTAYHSYVMQNYKSKPFYLFCLSNIPPHITLIQYFCLNAHLSKLIRL